MSSTSTLELEHELQQQLMTRGEKRAKIVRKQAAKEMKQLHKKEREKHHNMVVSTLAAAASSNSSSPSSVSGAASTAYLDEIVEVATQGHSICGSNGNGNSNDVATLTIEDIVSVSLNAKSPWDNAHCIILQEAWLAADYEHFLPSAQETVWSRQQSKAYHLKKLKEVNNPFSSRVIEWEPLEAQPTLVRPSTTMENAWVIDAVSEKELHSVAHGDSAHFRDLEWWAEQMDMFSQVEVHYKLASIKPLPVAPQHADCIVLYKNGDALSDRVSGAVVYDSQGQVRVDINFQHHNVVHGRYTILSGHFHVCQPGLHQHAAGEENHFGYQHCPWLWQAIPKVFNVKPLIPVGD